MNWLSAPISRGDRTSLGRWFWTVDKMLLLFVAALIGIGIIAVAAASPAAAHRLSGVGRSFDAFYFLKRQVMWVIAGVPILLGVSILSVSQVKRVALAATGLFFLALVAVAFVGTGTNGAARWLDLPGFQLQPSEFLKPVFVITTAWLLALGCSVLLLLNLGQRQRVADSRTSLSPMPASASTPATSTAHNDQRR